ncbi:MAG: 2-oxo acid dehydrogenase subunit E2 [Bacteroidetes bacterium]|nr:2-oxo acid dehydrogenase subunit E2 [Bacteroidota bacterium]
MAQIELLLPKMGESVAEATIIKWVKKEGEAVKADESIIEIATDKVDSEVPSPEDGTLLKCLVKEGDVVQVGQPIAIIQTGAAEAPAPAAQAPVAAAAPVAAPMADIPFVPAASGESIVSGDRFYSPLVKNMAKSEGISQAELDAIPGSGQGGRVTKDDLKNYLTTRGQKPAEAAPASAASVASAPAPEAAPAKEAPKRASISVNGNDEIVQMDRMRKLIADHMVMSKQVSPHVTSYVEADMTKVVQWRDKVKKNFEVKEKTKLTFTPIFIEAVARAIKDFPGVNASVDGDKIILRGDINIGMATALPSGNLIVPVIKNVDQLNLVGIAKKVNDLADRARNNKLTPDEIQGGTYTLTNVGSFGNVMGTPIINQPQVAILAVGAIRKKPAVIETPAGDFIGIRHMMFLSHSYDHRIVDGALGGMFVRRVADYLENWDVNREI